MKLSLERDPATATAPKYCTRCARWLEQIDFNRNGRAKDGLFQWCRECQCAQVRAWREAHPEARLAQAARDRAWGIANPDKLRARKARSRTIHREQDLEKKRVYNATHREQEQAWRAANQERDRATRAAYRAAHPERSRLYHGRLRAALFAAYGGACACCGETETCFLTLDHINQDGAAHRRQFGPQASNIPILRELRAKGWPQEGFRLLCWNCQWGVQRKDGCPHQSTAGHEETAA